MKAFVIQVLHKGAIVFLALIIISGFISGYTAGNIGTGLLGAVFAFIFAVPFFGFLFLMLEMNDNLRAIRKVYDSKPPPV